MVPSPHRMICAFSGGVRAKRDGRLQKASVPGRHSVFRPLQQRDGVRGDALTAAGEAEALLGRCLDAHARGGNAQRAGDVAAHLIAVGRELGRLGENRRIEVDGLKSGFGKPRFDSF